MLQYETSQVVLAILHPPTRLTAGFRSRISTASRILRVVACGASAIILQFPEKTQWSPTLVYPAGWPGTWKLVDGVSSSMRCNFSWERRKYLVSTTYARNRKEATPWGEHLRKKHPGVTLDKAPVFGNCRIIADAPQATTRKIREAVEIRDRKPAVNRVGGWRIAKTT